MDIFWLKPQILRRIFVYRYRLQMVFLHRSTTFYCLCPWHSAALKAVLNFGKHSNFYADKVNSLDE